MKIRDRILELRRVPAGDLSSAGAAGAEKPNRDRRRAQSYVGTHQGRSGQANGHNYPARGALRMNLDFAEFCTRYGLLVSKLPARGGRATAVTCRNCGTWTGLVANKAGIIFGQFVPDIRTENDIVSISTVLAAAFLIDDRAVPLKCMQCGYVTRWRR
jgi:hypothetical protein